MSYTYVDGRSFKATRPEIRLFRAYQRFERDRSLKLPHLDELATRIKEEGLKPFEWAITHCEENDEWYRVDGNHSLHLLESYTNEELAECRINFSEYTCETVNDVADLLRSFNSAMSVKTTNEEYSYFYGAYPELAGVPDAALNKVLNGLTLAVAGDIRSTKTTRKERGNLPGEYHEFAVWFGKIYEKSNHKRDIFGRAGIVGGMFHTFNDNKKKAAEFWALVESGNGHNQSPAVQLRNFVRLYKAGTGGSGERGKAGVKYVPNDVLMATVVAAFKKFKNGTDRTRMNDITHKTFAGPEFSVMPKSLDAGTVKTTKRNATVATANAPAGTSALQTALGRR